MLRRHAASFGFAAAVVAGAGTSEVLDSAWNTDGFDDQRREIAICAEELPEYPGEVTLEVPDTCKSFDKHDVLGELVISDRWTPPNQTFYYLRTAGEFTDAQNAIVDGYESSRRVCIILLGCLAAAGTFLVVNEIARHHINVRITTTYV